MPTYLRPVWLHRKALFLGVFELRLCAQAPVPAVLPTAFANAELLEARSSDMHQDVLQHSLISSHGEVLSLQNINPHWLGKQKLFFLMYLMIGPYELHPMFSCSLPKNFSLLFLIISKQNEMQAVKQKSGRRCHAMVLKDTLNFLEGICPVSLSCACSDPGDYFCCSKIEERFFKKQQNTERKKPRGCNLNYLQI